MPWNHEITEQEEIETREEERCAMNDMYNYWLPIYKDAKWAIVEEEMALYKRQRKNYLWRQKMYNMLSKV